MYLDVSENSGTPKSSILIGFSIKKTSILGYHYFRKHPFQAVASPALGGGTGTERGHFFLQDLKTSLKGGWPPFLEVDPRIQL